MVGKDQVMILRNYFIRDLSVRFTFGMSLDILYYHAATAAPGGGGGGKHA